MSHSEHARHLMSLMPWSSDDDLSLSLIWPLIWVVRWPDSFVNLTRSLTIIWSSVPVWIRKKKKGPGWHHGCSEKLISGHEIIPSPRISPPSTQGVTEDLSCSLTMIWVVRHGWQWSESFVDNDLSRSSRLTMIWVVRWQWSESFVDNDLSRSLTKWTGWSLPVGNLKVVRVIQTNKFTTTKILIWHWMSWWCIPWYSYVQQ
jgi:hypothetical protein